MTEVQLVQTCLGVLVTGIAIAFYYLHYIISSCSLSPNKLID